MFAIGNDELALLPPAKGTAKCPTCDKKHRITYGKTDGKMNKTLGFIKCGVDLFLVAINGKLLK